jgi:hypothetical protein
MANATSRWIASAACALLACEALAVELVVIESNAPAYAAGSTLDAAKPLVLAAGHFVVLAAEDGRVVRFAGPRNAPVSSTAPEAETPAADDVVSAVARLFGRRGPELGGVAGVRGGADEASADTRPDAWLVHSERTGDQCFIPRRGVELWREAATGAGSGEVEDVVARTTARLAWADERRAPWPATLVPESGRVYLVRPDDELRSVAIRMVALPQGLEGDDAASVAWLAAKGCLAQARVLLGQIEAARAR